MSLIWNASSSCSELTQCGKYAIGLYRRHGLPAGQVSFTVRAYHCPPGLAFGKPPQPLAETTDAVRAVALQRARHLCEEHAKGVASTVQTRETTAC